jgi:hypothetical protein
VTFTLDASDPQPLPQAGRVVGVDPGVTDFAVTSAGAKIPSPRPLERTARSLARHPRRLARCREGPANRAKAAAKVTRAHRKVRHAGCARRRNRNPGPRGPESPSFRAGNSQRLYCSLRSLFEAAARLTCSARRSRR